MALEVIWTPLAIKQLESILRYLELNWSDAVVKNFARRIEDRVDMISKHPEICKPSDRYVGARECLLTKHNTMFYVIKSGQIYIVTLWDNRQDPQLLQDLLKS